MYCFYPIIYFNSFGEGERKTQYLVLLYPFIISIFTTTIYLPILLYPIYLLTYFPIFTTSIYSYYSPCITLSIIHLLCFNCIFLLILILLNNSILLTNVYFFCYSNMRILSCFLNQGTNSFSHKGGRNVMIPNHAQPAYPQGRMYRHFLLTYRHHAIRGEA